KHLGPEYAAQFRDPGVVAAYPNRPPYPPELFDVLVGLIRDEPQVVLDLGCGTGDVARILAPRVARVDAVDPSPAMLARGRALPRAEHPHLRWIHAAAETFDYPGPYALMVAAASMHWMDWEVVLPRIERALSPQGRLALVIDRPFVNLPWEDQLLRLLMVYSTNRDYVDYSLIDALTSRRLFAPESTRQPATTPSRRSGYE